MRIIVDGFGGDNAPLAVLEGCRMAVLEYGVEIVLTGDEKKLRDCADEHQIPLDGMEIVHAPSVIPVDAHPQDIMTEYADSSMAEAMRLLAAGKGDAVVCAGSTGAMVVSASLMVRRIKGVKRATLAPIIRRSRAAISSWMRAQMSNAVRRCSCSSASWARFIWTKSCISIIRAWRW